MPFAKVGRTALLLLTLFPGMASAQVVGIALDAKAELVNGELRIVKKPPPDSAVFYAFEPAGPRLLGQVTLPTSFQGPPSGVAIPADGRLALVSAARQIDSSDASALVPGRRLSVVDLTARPIRVVQTLSLSAPPSAVAVDRSGQVALATQPDDDSISVLAIEKGNVRVREKVTLEKGDAPIAAAIAPDGRHALVTLSGRNRVGLFAIEDGRLKLPAIREMTAGVYPTIVAYCGNSEWAVVANYGSVSGDADTVSLMNVGAKVPHVVDTTSVGPSPEGVACSPDGRYVAAAVQNMSTVSADNPQHDAHSRVVLLRIEGGRLRRVAEAPIGGWSQGVGFFDGGNGLFAESMMDRRLHLFRIRDDRLVGMEPIRYRDAAPAAAGVAGQ